MSNHHNYYIDMDGVLVRYDRNAYTGNDPLFMRKNEHYYRNLEPDQKMRDFVRRLYLRSQHTGDRIYILTSLTNDSAIFNEHFHDKIMWLRTWIPYLDIDNILISVTSKRDAVEYIHNHTLTADDVLIDDYNHNLNEWRDAGGTAIKSCNGLNDHRSFQGPYFDEAIVIDDMLSHLDSILATERNRIPR